MTNEETAKCNRLLSVVDRNEEQLKELEEDKENCHE